LAQKII
jgi:NIMA (never in mitosis gene a)-related kinase